MMNNMMSDFESCPGVLSFSAKDILSASKLLDMAMQSLNNIPYDPSSDNPAEYLWELALKLRGTPEHTKEALAHGVISKCEHVIMAKPVGGWNAFLASIGSNHIWPTLNLAQLATSVLHEVCRYRSGCVALAKHGEVLQSISQLPLSQIQAQFLHETTVSGMFCNPGMFEQALVDTVGRCINGLDEDHELRAGVQQRFRSSSRLLDGIKSGTANVRAFVAKFGDGIDTRFLDLDGSHERLCALLAPGASAPKWRSTYCMERIEIRGRTGTTETTAIDRAIAQAVASAVPTQPVRHAHDKTCFVCTKRGPIGEVVKYCARCRITCYCSVECQTAHWPLHKKECVEQRRSTAPGNLGNLGQILG